MQKKSQKKRYLPKLSRCGTVETQEKSEKENGLEHITHENKLIN